MSPLRSQDTRSTKKSQFYFYIPTMNKFRQIKKYNIICITPKKIT